VSEASANTAELNTSADTGAASLSCKEWFGRPWGRKSWRWEAELKPLWRGRSYTLPVMTGNADKCAS